MKIKDTLNSYKELKLKDFSKILFKNNNSINSICPFLVISIKDEFNRRNFSSRLIECFLKDKILQTSHHQCLTNGPTFLAIDIISISGLALNDPYFVATYSALPYSNNALSGAITFEKVRLSQLFKQSNPNYLKINNNIKLSQSQGAKEKRIYLIKGNLKDNLVYNSKISSFTKELFNQFLPEVKDKLIDPKNYKYYSDWALDFCQNIQRKILSNSNIFYFDIVRIIKNYLLKLIKEKQYNTIIKLLISKETLLNIDKLKINPILFVEQKEKIIYWRLSELINYIQYDIDKLEIFLLKKNVCPAIFIIIQIMIFENNIAFLGSFLQYRYIPEFLIDYNKIRNFLRNDPIKLDIDNYNRFSGGRLPSNVDRYPLDILINNDIIDVSYYINKPMSFFWDELFKNK